MRNKKLSFVLTGLMALGIMLASASQVFANEDPPDTGEIVDPKLWAVIVIDCGAQATATMRVKRIVDCNVEVQAESMSWSTCPSDAGSVMWWQFDTLNLFGINPNPSEGTMHPIITKVKNFQKEPDKNVYSFDVELMFWQP
jgi:hypothetical protein